MTTAGPTAATYLLSLARVIVGFLLLRHGLEQAIGFPPAFVDAPSASALGLLKWLALPGGALLMLGLFTRPAAAVLGAASAVYWVLGPLSAALTEGATLFGARGPSDPPLLNACFCAYLVAAGPGVVSVDAWRNRAEALAARAWAPHALSVLRVVVAFLFLHHGIEKFLGPRPAVFGTLRWVAGVLELVGGPLFLAGLFTRPFAFLFSGEMAFAYFINHAPDGFWGSFAEPNQQAAILNSFLFLFLSAAGGGAWSVDALRSRGRVRAMRVERVAGLVIVALLGLPAAALAQSSITGLVRDTSGAVLPGVTVEASSPVLIESTKSGVTDGQGLYRIPELRPGTYTVTFTLPGFATVRREGLELRAEFVATVNADLSPGALEETVTVTGAAPTVDIRNSREQVQFEKETLESLPGAGRLTTLAAVIPGATLTQEFNRGVGGTSDRTQTRYSLHGGPEAQPFVDGMNQQLPNSTQGVFVYNQLNIQEVVLETSGVGADRDSGGMQINMIPRDGGNIFSGTAIAAYSGPSLEASNINDDLLARGLDPRRVGALKKFRDLGGAVGGPIKRERLWFFAAAREGVTQQYADGIYWNRLQQPQSLRYEPDLSRPAFTNDYSKDASIRVTWQATPKHKIVGSTSFQNNCNCVFNLLTTGTQITPEAAGPHAYTPNYNPTFTWTFPATSNVLLEAGIGWQNLDQDDGRAEGVPASNFRIMDQALNLFYGNVATRIIPRRQAQQRMAFSYITGSHNFKVGFNLRQTRQGDIERIGFDQTMFGTSVDYRFNNGVPNQLTLLDAPWTFEESVTDSAVYIQDQWTIRRLTVNLGLRYNDVNASTPEQVLGAGYFVPERRFAAVDGVPHYRNLNPRLGVAYDLFGTGRTAIKASLSQYPEIVRVATGNPSSNLVRNTNRTWNDTNTFPAGDPRNGNFVPDCDLRNPLANGECGQWSNLTFGQPIVGTRYSEDALSGFNKQYHNWQSSLSVQHELRPGVGVTVGYYRTWYGGTCGGSGLTNTVTCLLATDNLAVTPADFDQFCITAPADSRLPNGGGNQLCGLYDVRPALFGRVDNLARPVSDFGKRTRVFNGVDMTVNARLGRAQVSGGVSIGRIVTDDCVLVDSPQDLREGFCKVVPPWSAMTQGKFMVVYALPWDVQTSAIYQNSAGIPITANLVVSNASIAPSLGRNLAACGAAATCNANVTVPLIPTGTMFAPRLQQVDLRFSRLFSLGGNRRIRGNLDIYNVLNASNVLNMNTNYGATWQNVTQILSGRLFRIGAQLDF